MTIQYTDAVYENGVFRPREPLVMTEGTQVRLTITTVDEHYDPLEAVIGIGEGPSKGDGAQQHDQYIYGDLRR